MIQKKSNKEQKQGDSVNKDVKGTKSPKQKTKQKFL